MLGIRIKRITPTPRMANNPIPPTIANALNGVAGRGCEIDLLEPVWPVMAGIGLPLEIGAPGASDDRTVPPSSLSSSEAEMEFVGPDRVSMRVASRSA